MHEGPELSTTSPVPSPRVPTHDTLPATQPEPTPSAESEAAEPAEPAESEQNGSDGPDPIASEQVTPQPTTTEPRAHDRRF